MWGRRGLVVGAWLRASGAGGIASLILCLFAPVASAQSVEPNTEIFTGVEASDNYASVYVGGGTALGKGLYEPGFRLRAVASFGRYHYDGTLFTDGDYVPTTFDGEDAFLAALAGYQFRKGPFIAKLFAGIEAEDQHISPARSQQFGAGERGRALASRPRLGSTLRQGCSSRLTPPTARPSKNIVRLRAWAFVCGRISHSAWKVERLATRNTMPAKAVASSA